MNLGGQNSDFSGDFFFNAGTLNLLADSTYFSAQNSTFYNNVNFNMVNGQINDVNFGNLTLNGQTNVFADVNFSNNTMDRINANSLNGSGEIFVAGLSLQGVPEAQKILIPL